MPEPHSLLPRDVQPPPQRGVLPPLLLDLLVPALKVGAMSGAAGTITGLAAGIVKDVHPALFATASTIQCFTLGSSFWFSRSVVIQTWGGDHILTPRDRTIASAVGGGVAGAVGGLIRGPRNIIPGTLVCTIFGATGQSIANKFEKRKGREKSEWFTSKWSPLRKLSDDEYEGYMSEKMLKIDTEIALIDDKIAELREEERATQGAMDPFQNPPPLLNKQEDTTKATEKPRAAGWWRWP